MTACSGNNADHCCYVGSSVCEFLEENTVPGRRWVCGLFRELGSWEAVHADSRYTGSAVAAIFQAKWPGYNCGDYPPPGVTCGTCGVSGG